MFDPGAFIQGLLTALQAVLPNLMQVATDAMAKLLTERGNAAWQQMTDGLQQSSVNFLTRTPPELSYNMGGVSDFYHQYDPMFYGLGAFGCVFAGVCALGRVHLGWGWQPGEWATRHVLGLLLGMNALRIYGWTIDFNNRLCDAIVSTPLPNAHTGEGMDPLTLAAVIVVWLVLGFRLLWRMGYRIIYLDMLLITGPIGLAAWAIPGGQPYASWWTRTYVGLLLGQDLVAIAIRVAGMMNGPLGSTFAGLAMGIGALLLAYDLATIFAEIKGGGLSSVIAGAARAVAVVL